MIKSRKFALVGAGVLMFALFAGCRNHMPHAFTWPGGGT